MKILKKTDDYAVEATKRRIFVNSSKPALVINQNGIEDHSTYFGIGFLAWDEIEKIVVYEADAIFIGIFPYDIDKFKAQASLIKKIGIFTNQKVAIKAPFNIPAANLREPLPEVFAQMLCRIPSGQEDKLHGFEIEEMIEHFPEIVKLVD